jgi:hypothetical protein
MLACFIAPVAVLGSCERPLLLLTSPLVSCRIWALFHPLKKKILLKSSHAHLPVMPPVKSLLLIASETLASDNDDDVGIFDPYFEVPDDLDVSAEFALWHSEESDDDTPPDTHDFLDMLKGNAGGVIEETAGFDEKNDKMTTPLRLMCSNLEKLKKGNLSTGSKKEEHVLLKLIEACRAFFHLCQDELDFNSLVSQSQSSHHPDVITTLLSVLRTCSTCSPDADR